MRLIYFISLLLMSFNCNGQNTEPTKPIKKKASESTSQLVDMRDSTYLQIDISKGNYTVWIMDKAVSTNTLSLVDNFIFNNKSLIHQDKILLVKYGNVKSESVKKIIHILKKHGLTNFKMATRKVHL